MRHEALRTFTHDSEDKIMHFLARTSVYPLSVAALVVAALASPAAATTQTGPPSARRGLELPHSQLDAIAEISSNDAWAVGSTPGFDAAVAYHWDGTAWTRSTIGCNCSLTSVSAVSSDDIWAVGNAANAVAVHWNGESWTQVSLPHVAQSHLVSVSADASNDVWAVGWTGDFSDHDLHTLTEHWDGSSWSVVNVVPSGEQTDDEQFRAVHAISPEDVLVGGNRSAHALFYHWNGTIWTRSRGIHGIPYAMSGTSAIDDWAVGSAPRGNSTAHWDGSAWHRVANPDEGTVTMLQAATSVAADDVWAGGYSDEPLGTKLSPLLEHWDGTTWVRVDAPKPLHGHNNIVTGLASTSGSDVWAVGLSYHSGFHVRHSFIMHWDGSHWTL